MLIDSDELILGDAVRIVNQAQQAGIIVRLLGATAVRVQAAMQTDLFHRLERLGSGGKIFTDIDLAAYSKQRSSLRRFLEKNLGFKLDQYSVLMHGSDRMILHHPEGKYSLDVFYDKLQYSHDIHFGSDPRHGRLSFDPLTISTTDLVLEKTQIHEINEKDIKDLVTLFAACRLADEEGPGVINRKYIANVLAHDWGFWYDVKSNLDKVIHFSQKYVDSGKLDSGILATITQRISDLHRTVDEAPKSKKWQKRSEDGTSRKWWNEVEERHR